MTVIATASNPRFSVSRVDVDRERSDVHDRHPDRPAPAAARCRAVLHHRRRRARPDRDLARRGSDVRLARFVGCTRPGTTIDDTTLAGLPPDRVTIIEVPALAISSTECRARASVNEPVWYLVPDGVVQYIAKRGLYQLPTSSVHPAARGGQRFVTATDRAHRARQERRGGGLRQARRQHHRLRRLRPAHHHRRVRALLGAERPAGAGRSSTPSRSGCGRPAPSRYGARASATGGGCCSTTARSSCTSSTRRSGSTTRWSGSGATAR